MPLPWKKLKTPGKISGVMKGFKIKMQIALRCTGKLRPNLARTSTVRHHDGRPKVDTYEGSQAEIPC